MSRRKTEFPYLSRAEVLDAVEQITGVDRELARAVIEAYYTAIRQAAEQGIEVDIPLVGIVTYKKEPPKPRGMYWNGFAKEMQEYPRRQGFYRPVFKFKRELINELKKNTLYGEAPTVEEYNECAISRHGDKARLMDENGNVADR